MEYISALVFLIFFITFSLYFLKDVVSDDVEDYDHKLRYIDELTELLYYVEMAVDECIDDPEEREKILSYIYDYDDLIIEDRIRFLHVWRNRVYK